MAAVARRRATMKSRSIVNRWITAGFWLLALTLAALHAWIAARSGSMNADGVVYLDIGDAYLRGDWPNAINPVWSPLYSWVLGAVMAIVQPPMAWEFPLVHLVNLALFIFTLLCFDFFWRQLGRWREEAAEVEGHSLPGWAWLAVGYSLFLWVALALIAIWAVTPDMLMAGFALLAAGLVVRVRRGQNGWLSFLLLGAALGLGYLTKTIMFPLAFVFLVVAWLSAGDLRRGARGAVVGLLAFLLISLPFIFAISRSHGSVTFGEAGTITYLRHVQGLTNPHQWGEEGGVGSPSPPSRQLLSFPPVYEFGAPIGGTYPISYNPAYWYAGAEAEFDLGRQLQALARNALYYFELFGRQQGGLLALVALLYAVGARRLPPLLALIRRWGLLLPALAALLLYAAVYVEGRYIGVLLLLFWADLLANIRLPGSPSGRRTIRVASLLMIVFLLANLAAFNLEGYGRLAEAGSAELPEEDPPARPAEVAEALAEMGVRPGSAVGVVGYAYDSYWARLARVRVAAELVDWPGNPFWSDAAAQKSVVEAFAGSGVCAIVAEYAPAHAALPGWRQVGASSYYVYLLREECR